MSKYYIVLKDSHGSDYALFWRPDESGYTRIIDRAGKYSEQEAKNICGYRGKEIMVPCEVVEAAALRVADWAELYMKNPEDGK